MIHNIQIEINLDYVDTAQVFDDHSIEIDGVKYLDYDNYINAIETVVNAINDAINNLSS